MKQALQTYKQRSDQVSKRFKKQFKRLKIGATVGALFLSLSSQASALPVAIFDLDETLIYSHARKAWAWKEALKLESAELRRRCEPLALRLGEAHFVASSNAYDFLLVLAALSFPGDSCSQADQVQSELGLLKIYLSGQGLELDTEIPGAARFLRQWVSRTGGKVFYVSSRWNRAQRMGTLGSLKKLGFPLEDEKQLWLREEGESSLQFKRRAFLAIAQLPESHVELVGENEPENLEIFLELFPSARVLFIEGAQTSEVQNPDRWTRVEKIRNYLKVAQKAEELK